MSEPEDFGHEDCEVCNEARLKRIADCETAHNFLLLSDDDKRAWFALHIEESSRRKKAEDERDAAVKALERIKNHVDTDEYAYEIAVAAIDAARREK